MIEDIRTEIEMLQNNKTHNSISADENDTKIQSLPPNNEPKEDEEKVFKHTETVFQTKIGSHWYINQYLCYTVC